MQGFSWRWDEQFQGAVWYSPEYESTCWNLLYFYSFTELVFPIVLLCMALYVWVDYRRVRRALRKAKGGDERRSPDGVGPDDGTAHE